MMVAPVWMTGRIWCRLTNSVTLVPLCLTSREMSSRDTSASDSSETNECRSSRGVQSAGSRPGPGGGRGADRDGHWRRPCPCPRWSRTRGQSRSTAPPPRAGPLPAAPVGREGRRRTARTGRWCGVTCGSWCRRAPGRTAKLRDEAGRSSDQGAAASAARPALRVLLRAGLAPAFCGRGDVTQGRRAAGARARGACTRPAGCGRRRSGARSSRGRRPGSRRRCVLRPWPR